MHPGRLPSLLALLASLLLAIPARADTPPAPGSFLRLDARATDRLIVRLRSNVLVTQSLHRHLRRLAQGPLTPHRVMGNGAQVYQLAAHMPLSHVAAIAARLAHDPNVLYAEPDVRVRGDAITPNDPMYAQQWDLFDPIGGINAPGAWAITTGSPRIIIADIDTGARFDHEDLRGRLIAGYDFVDHDMNPTDPGTMMDGAIVWHGSHTAGTMGAATNNGLGIAGINWVSKILVVRVLDRNNFAYTSTVADAIRWAIGESVPGAPPNRTPAQVINFSAGGDWNGCESSYQEAINDARSRNVVFVTSAGNNGQDASSQEPANCSGVITVAAIDPSGSRASYSNYGPRVSIAAPGTNTWSAGAAWNMTPHSYEQMIGTSMAAPHVSGVVSLMLSVNPSLTPDTVLNILQRTARRFPPGANCSGICQVGILNAGAAVSMAASGRISTPPARPAGTMLHALAGASRVVQPGVRVRLWGGAQVRAPARVTAWQWQQLGGPMVRLSNPRAPRPLFIAPRTPAQLVFRLTVRDSNGHTASATTRVSVTAGSGSTAFRRPAG